MTGFMPWRCRRTAVTPSPAAATAHCDGGALETGKCPLILRGHAGGVGTVALSSDGRHALSGGGDETLRWSGLDGGRCLAVFPCEEQVMSAALGRSPSESCYVVVAGLVDGQVQFFRLEGT